MSRQTVLTVVLAGAIGCGAGCMHAQSREAWEQKSIEAVQTYEVEKQTYLAEKSADTEEVIHWEDVAIEGEGVTDVDLAEEMYWDELELLAQVVEAEAGNQDLTGKRLVVDVVLNRVDSPLFPDTITEVLEQANQFETMANGAVEAAGWHMQAEDYEAVLMELESRLDYDIYYFTAGAYNKSCTPAYIYGDHYFGGLSASAAKEVVKLSQQK